MPKQIQSHMRLYVRLWAMGRALLYKEHASVEELKYGSELQEDAMEHLRKATITGDSFI